jgi:tetraacyldisaccharide 4'-kinase
MYSLLLLPASWLYAALMLARNWCYDRRIFTVSTCPVPVISIGNMTAGGTGKTPFTEFLVRLLLNSGKSVAVISRGYGRATSGTLVVSDGRNLLARPRDAGDEAYQIARKFPSAVVIVDERRPRAAAIAVERYRAQVIVLDDGFQHRALKRDLDIVMLDDRRPLAEIPLLPAGLRREPLSGLARAELLAAPASANDPLGNGARRYTGAPLVRFRKAPVRFVSVFGEGSASPGEMREKECTAVCGIGNPDSFRETLRQVGMKADRFVAFPDHHAYTERDVDELRALAGRSRTRLLVTTEKDAVKLASLAVAKIAATADWYYLEIAAEIVEGEELLREKIGKLFKAAGQ